MRALAADLPLIAARRQAIDARHDRLPVYRASLDDVVGYVEWFDLFGSDDPAWTDRLRELPVLPESLSASVALARLRDEEAELALVLDEHGGTAGILTCATSSTRSLNGRRPTSARRSRGRRPRMPLRTFRASSSRTGRRRRSAAT